MKSNNAKEFQTRLAEELETLFPKGERCECGKRLRCRSKALVFCAEANIIFRESLDKVEIKQINKNNMEIYLGETGLDKSWQSEFPKEVKCHKCGENARIMFVVQENYPHDKDNFICQLHTNMKDEKYWPHDAIACAVYLCEKCFEPNALLNQA